MMKRQRFSLPLMLSLMLGGVLYSLQPAQAQERGQPNSDAGVTPNNTDSALSGGPQTGGTVQGTPQITVQQTSSAIGRITNDLQNGEFGSSPGSEGESTGSTDATAPIGESESPSEPNQQESEEAQANEIQQEQQQVPEQPEEPEEDEEQMQQQQQQQPVRGLW